jgi:hypothetical protein
VRPPRQAGELINGMGVLSCGRGSSELIGKQWAIPSGVEPCPRGCRSTAKCFPLRKTNFPLDAWQRFKGNSVSPEILKFPKARPKGGLCVVYWLKGISESDATKLGAGGQAVKYVPPAWLSWRAEGRRRTVIAVTALREALVLNLDNLTGAAGTRSF